MINKIFANLFCAGLGFGAILLGLVGVAIILAVDMGWIFFLYWLGVWLVNLIAGTTYVTSFAGFGIIYMIVGLFRFAVKN